MPNKKHLAKYALISTLKSSRPKARAHLIGYLNDSGIKLLSEAVFNVQKKHNSIKRRRRLLQQHGSDLRPLLSIAA